MSNPKVEFTVATLFRLAQLSRLTTSFSSSCFLIDILRSFRLHYCHLLAQLFTSNHFHRIIS